MGGIFLFMFMLIVAAVAFFIVMTKVFIKGVDIFSRLLDNKKVVGCAWIIVAIVAIVFLLVLSMTIG